MEKGPLMAGGVEAEDNIHAYEEIGTHPPANHNAILVAVAFHRSIGAERKTSRLRFLRDRRAHQVLASSDRAHKITKIGPKESGAIGVLAIDGMDVAKLGSWLMANHHFVTTPMVADQFHGIRITPSICTTAHEVDMFADRGSRGIREGLVRRGCRNS